MRGRDKQDNENINIEYRIFKNHPVYYERNKSDNESINIDYWIFRGHPIYYELNSRTEMSKAITLDVEFLKNTLYITR